MELLIAACVGLLGLVLGGAGAYLWATQGARQEVAALQEELITLHTTGAHLRESLQQAEARYEQARETLADRDEELGDVRTRLALLESQRRGEKQMLEEKVEELKQLREKFETTFRALSSDALKANREEFMALAKNAFSQLMQTSQGDLDKRQTAIQTMVDPMSKTLKEFDEKVQHLERARSQAYVELQQQVKALQETNHMLRGETQSLVQALRTPQVRGQWGELHLKRAIEVAGLAERVDFDVQVSTRTDEDRVLRPDMVIRLPSERVIVVDCKTPADAYLAALQTEVPEERTAQLRRHAQHVRKHIEQLSDKAYWRQVQELNPEFVVLFLPNEAFFSAAVQQDPGLIEYGASRNVMIATPTTLIALLKTVAFGWRQERLAQEAKETSDLAQELYERVVTFVGYFDDLGRSLGKSVEHYNKAVNSFEKRVSVTGRKLEHLSQKQLPDITPIDKLTSSPSLPDGTGS
ncbi:MAG: DNA recombination protein RmuC [Verrucomicrobiota bacterium JB022]|nr:DNA recombination protein RmuC [Verrucomicrobiota bacterium JB022]